MTKGERLALAASVFIGVRYRLQGRDPATGLDCVGLLAVSLGALGIPISAPIGYGLRNTTIAGWLESSVPSAFEKAGGAIRTGDVLLTRPGPQQHHLLIAEARNRVIHAHAGLRKVVCQRRADSEQILAKWRLRND